MIKVGKILSSHGLSGNVKVISFFETPEDIFRYRITDSNNSDLNGVRVGSTGRKDVFLVKFEHINSIEEAKIHNGTELFVDTEDLPPLLENEIYIENLVGMSVVAGDRRGTVSSLVNYGAGDVLEIEWNSGGSEYIIYNEDTVEKVDKQNRIIKIHLPSYI
ncbi:MAG: ribosome maturation factor RimM [Rickettsiales bacterium]|jgi:16S rRNA processing protein RimM|nr:ribosome maturation factor RimM [Rickettsiales bacterium]